jgi:hypothetical protein
MIVDSPQPDQSPEPTAVGALPFRYRGPRRESAVARLFSLGHSWATLRMPPDCYMKIPRILVGVIFVGWLACGFLSGCAHTHGGAASSTASTPAVVGNPNGSWFLYIDDGTNKPSKASTPAVAGNLNGSWFIYIGDGTNNPSK